MIEEVFISPLQSYQNVLSKSSKEIETAKNFVEKIEMIVKELNRVDD